MTLGIEREDSKITEFSSQGDTNSNGEGKTG